MFINVSLHDVTPAFADEIKCLFDLIQKAGVTRGSILVVPDFHCRAPLQSGSAFVDWLRRRAGEGWEIILHGLTHIEDQKNNRPGTLWGRLVSRYYTDGEGEFYRLSRADAQMRIDRGMTLLTTCHLAPAGFIAPAWLLSRPGRFVLREFDFAFTTTLTGIYNLKSEVFHNAPALCFSSRSSWRAALSRLVVPALAGVWSRQKLVRLVLHPVDAHHPGILNVTENLLHKMLAHRRQVTIAEYLELAKTGWEG